MPNYAALHDELIGDPLGIGYAAMSDVQAVNSLNTVNQSVPVEEVPAAELIEATIDSDWTGVGAVDRERYSQMVTGGSINPSGPETQAHIETIFGSGSATLANVVALGSRLISRGDEIGFGFVKPPHVNEARAMVR